MNWRALATALFRWNKSSGRKAEIFDGLGVWSILEGSPSKGNAINSDYVKYLYSKGITAEEMKSRVAREEKFANGGTEAKKLVGIRYQLEINRRNLRRPRFSRLMQREFEIEMSGFSTAIEEINRAIEKKVVNWAESGRIVAIGRSGPDSPLSLIAPGQWLFSTLDFPKNEVTGPSTHYYSVRFAAPSILASKEAKRMLELTSKSNKEQGTENYGNAYSLETSNRRVQETREKILKQWADENKDKVNLDYIEISRYKLWDVLRDIDPALFPPLSNESKDDFFDDQEIVKFKRGRRKRPISPS